MFALARRFIRDESGFILGLSLMTYTCLIGGFATIVVLGLFAADGLVRLHAHDVVSDLLGDSQYLVSNGLGAGPATGDRSFASLLRKMADKRLAALQIPGLSERIVRLDIETPRPQVVRITMVTEAVYPSSLTTLFRVDPTRYRAMSAQETALTCMPSGVRFTREPKAPAIVRRDTGILDRILLHSVEEAPSRFVPILDGDEPATCDAQAALALQREDERRRDARARVPFRIR